MEFRRLRRKLNMIKAAALVSLAAALCLAGCSNTQPAAPSHTFDTALPLEEMGKLCYYRDERDAQFDADMEIVEGRIDAMTDGNYLKEETELETTEGTKYAVNFYIPMDVYGDYSLRDISRILISSVAEQ